MDPLVMGAGAAVLTAVVAGLGVRRRAKKLVKRDEDPADRALVALLIALGHDPAKTLFQVVRRGRKSGIQVRTRDGRPLRFYRLAELERMKKDPAKRHLFAVARAT